MAESPPASRENDAASGSSPSSALFTSPENDGESANGSPRAANRQPSPPRMLPPPHGRRFPTEETAEAFLKHFSISAGYKIVRKRSAGKGKDGKIIAYECHLAGAPRGGRTKKIGCPFRITLDCLKRTNYEYEINSQGVRQHNHGPNVEDPPRPRRPPPPQRLTITMSVNTYFLPALPYAYDALEPSISKQIMELHHSKHHQAYVTNLNKALFDLAAAVQANDIDKQITLQSAINFNGGGHINHSLFWQNLAPASSPEASRPEESAPSLLAEIGQTWGSLDAFKQAFSAKLLTIQGSGWGWLVKVAGPGDRKPLQIITTKDQDPVPNAFVPVFGVDMWEHAYYLQYLNGKAAYVENIWKIINWRTAEERFLGGRADAFKVLQASLGSGQSL